MTASRIPHTTGWLSFAGIVAIVVGVFNVIDGLVALFRNDYYLVTSQDILVFNFTAWGWIWLLLGLVQIVVGAGIIAGPYRRRRCGARAARRHASARGAGRHENGRRRPGTRHARAAAGWRCSPGRRRTGWSRYRPSP
jgi:hypothetical protein